MALTRLANDEFKLFKDEVEQFFAGYMASPAPYKGRGEDNFTSPETVEVVRHLLRWETDKNQKVHIPPDADKNIREVIRLNDEFRCKTWRR